MGRLLIQRHPRAVFADPKRETDFGGCPIVEGLDAFRREWPRHHERVIVRPHVTDDLRVWFDGVCQHVYQVGNTGFEADELQGIVSESRPLQWFTIVVSWGRTRGVTSYLVTQRPRRVPLAVLSEASQAFVFELLLPEDVARVREVIGPYPQPTLPHGFAHWQKEGLTGRPAVIECRPLSL